MSHASFAEAEWRAQAGDAAAQTSRRRHLVRHRDVDGSVAGPLWFIADAEQGHMVAQNGLGLVFAGWSVEHDAS